MKVIIDRFEGDFAVCEKEDKTMVDIEKGSLPSGVREGDVLLIQEDHIIVDESATAERKKRIRQRMDTLWS